MEQPEERRFLSTEELEDLNTYLRNMKLMYRPPGGDYTLLTDYLNTVEERLRRLEDGTTGNTDNS